jgi:LemA protein
MSYCFVGIPKKSPPQTLLGARWGATLQKSHKEVIHMIIYVVLGVLLLVLIYLIVTYNSFIKLKNVVEEAFATMDVYLKKRWDLIPNLVETVKGYAKHESSLFENVVALRNSSYDKMSLNDKISTNEKLSAGIARLFAVAENYPDLKASQNFLDLSAQLSKVEDEIAKSRKYYNAVVKNMNTKVEMFPSNIIAGMFGFKRVKMFEVPDEERANIKVEL